MPSEWPRQTVTALVTRNNAKASQVKVSGAPMTPVSVMAEIHSDLSGFHRTPPSTALVSSASTMRGERNVLSDRCSASATGPAGIAAPSQAAVAATLVGGTMVALPDALAFISSIII